MTLPGAFNQVSWPGVGDIDDCQVLSAFWTMVAAGWATKANLPSVSKFRYEAGNPDDPGRDDGLTNAQSLRAIQRIWPEAAATSYIGEMDGFKDRLRAGAVASVSVNSAKLPPAMRFGFDGLHQVAVAFDVGEPFLMNPLQAQGARPIPIRWEQVREAAFGVFDDARVHAVIVPAAVDPTVPLKKEIAALKDQAAVRDKTISALRSKINAAKAALG